MTGLSEQVRDLARRLRASWKLVRQADPFFCEQDEIAHDLEKLARQFEGTENFSRETISERRIG